MDQPTGMRKEVEQAERGAEVRGPPQGDQQPEVV